VLSDVRTFALAHSTDHRSHNAVRFQQLIVLILLFTHKSQYNSENAYGPEYHSAQLARENNKKQNTCQKLIAISKTRIYTAGLHYNTSHIQMYTVFEKRGQIYKLKIDKMDTFFETGGMLLAVFYFDRN